MLNLLGILLGIGVGYEIDKEGIFEGTQGQGNTGTNGQGQKAPVSGLSQILKPIEKVPQTVKTDIYNTMKKEKQTTGGFSIANSTSNTLHTIESGMSTAKTDIYHALTQAKSDVTHAPQTVEHIATKTLPSEIYNSLQKDKNSVVDTANTVKNDLARVFRW